MCQFPIVQLSSLIIFLQGVSKILQFYNNKVGSALVDLYPEVKTCDKFIGTKRVIEGRDREIKRYKET
jgi:hypothetical protein